MPNPGVNGNGQEATGMDTPALALDAEENVLPNQNLPMLDIPMEVPPMLDVPFGDFPEVTIADTAKDQLNPNPIMVPMLDIPLARLDVLPGSPL